MQSIPFINFVEQDIVERVQILLSGGGYSINSKGLIEAPYAIEWRGPWIHVRFAPWHKCHYWSKILFPHVLQNKYVPSPCHECYKVVVSPRTVKELFALYHLMVELDKPSKCGTEGDRENSGRLYGGYFYNYGLKEGLSCYDYVRHRIDREPDLGPDVPVILKRGCTEYEQTLGRSDQWEITPEQVKLEAVAEKAFEQEEVQSMQPDYLKARIMRKWIERAYKWGDETYKEFTGGNPLYDPPVTYHDK
jgi:hypothetical protein